MNYILKNNLNIESNYTKTANSILINSPLSRDARIVFITLSSLASSFNPKKEFLCKQLEMNAKTLNKYLKELVQKGFLKIIYYKNKLGKFLGKRAYILAPTKEQLEQEDFIIVDESNRTETPKFTMRQIVEKQAEKPLKTEVCTETPIFTTLKKKNNNNKHEKMDESVSENLQNQADQKNKHDNFSCLISPNKIKNLSMFKRFSDFVFSILGNLDTRGLEMRDKQAFERFLNYRNEKGKLTYATKKALLKQALELKEQGQDIAKSVEQSIRKGYNELYALMEFKPSLTPQKQEEELFEYKPNPKYNGYCIW
ncbi:helix-turn-helix domain-containing protein [Helicobacter pylori]|uniref:helix-turn-helix domain-containing protein n=1 Tax=Helicobacter pylori TaxID=210 RepID=UPI00165B73C3|nr:helix-turn-helix domain-containing protein [Helicobacter pylori]MBH0236086.1 helix-turn-helix domain-containing protein [Helicobacter pylori]MBH0251696.1 helix-turn-helix domain-containing protein [Helicobacter pylori]MBH0271040.1 helix-turn-helix domain-containing protein [Helicobacter pylori]